MNKSYPIGETIFLRSVYDDPKTWQLTNPQNVVCRVLDPNGNEQRPSVVNTAVGQFTSRFTPNIPGTWYVRWEASGMMLQAVNEYEFTVRPSPFPT